ncbi:LPS assembly lipoprotein LptE [Afifella marina]|uniref:LPS-assembly lipoprotein n=1 Tax=Afifella marina DSM 2698 TaxID=1120955 RepID=A0A1G5NEU1_AFIMA|nr:LPS assembly lipoprotein LptE [Afifella marina]MBK1623412.1 hypothetical protein [Afifella marina DSM 2698]MBK1626406.1 hypothetical protein [Afifella marina]MBK5917284.1 hypothetical protein [Afifella marina]RAI18064.1 hypothetical protein CH311_16470 [Afifella marina DSM 2698]SCZ35694.1 LPS-assembly lipoprotein [Afifella marina DSM 2698]
MWSARRGFLILLAAGLVAGCTVRPLYAPDAAGRSVQEELRAIEVEMPTTRPEQVFRNALLFGLQDGETVPPQYRLEYTLALNSSSVGIEAVTGVPTAYQLSGRLQYRLFDISTGQQVLGAVLNTVASYDRSSQAFAKLRAERDAEDRVADTLAGILKTRLASYLARN